jgi:hypothetical protein
MILRDGTLYDPDLDRSSMTSLSTAFARLKVLKTLVAYRLIDPGSEWRLHGQWFERSAMGDLLGEEFDLAQKDNLYRCLDGENDLKGISEPYPRLAGVLRRWSFTRDGEGQVVLLSGEPGIGKSWTPRGRVY